MSSKNRNEKVQRALKKCKTKGQRIAVLDWYAHCCWRCDMYFSDTAKLDVHEKSCKVTVKGD